LKRDLAEKHHFDRVAYTEAKAPFITDIIKKAENNKKHIEFALRKITCKNFQLIKKKTLRVWSDPCQIDRLKKASFFR